MTHRNKQRVAQRITVIDRQQKFPAPTVAIKTLLRVVLGKRPWSVNVVLVDNREIRRINRQFLNHDYATDVISFDLSERGDLAGDVVVSAEFAAGFARREGIAYREELLRYCLHGALHLLGYNDHNPRQRKKMWHIQERILMRYLRR